VASSRTVLIAGAGIGGLTAALALAQRGFRVEVFEQAERLEEVGAGIQLSPNATQVLMDLGLGERLQPHVVVPEELRVIEARSGRILARGPLGAGAQARYGAPYWVIHRGALQAVLADAVLAHPDISLALGTRVEGFTIQSAGVTIAAVRSDRMVEARGIALIGADGLWSTLQAHLGHRDGPRFAGHTAWRALVAAEGTPPELVTSAVHLWLGHDAHLVHYPVQAGRLINLVAIVRDDVWRESGWSAPGARGELLARYPTAEWHAGARALIATGQTWHKWALSDCAPFVPWGKGPVTLLGDAAHPMLPYLAQGAAMAIEDAAVLGVCLEREDDPDTALRSYEHERFTRTRRTQRAARRNGIIYHMGGAAGTLRRLALLAMGGRRLMTRYDWLYGWRLTSPQR
jgi:salicylate hydroxylase